MEIGALREKLHSLIESTSEEKLLQVYAVLEEDFGYTEDFKNELSEEYVEYLKDEKVISKSKLDIAIDKLLSPSKS